MNGLLRLLVLPACISILMVLAQAVAEAAPSSYPERLEGHGGPVRSVAISADGTRALTASFDYSAIVWSLEGDEARVLSRLTGHDAAVNDAAFVPGRTPEVMRIWSPRLTRPCRYASVCAIPNTSRAFAWSAA